MLGEEYRWPSSAEAERQLHSAASNGEITATAEFMDTTTAPPITCVVPPVAFNFVSGIRASTIILPWGRYLNIRFADAELNDLWKPKAGPKRADWPTSMAELRKVISETGNKSEAELRAALAMALSGKSVSRDLVRKVREETFGPARRGRPPIPR